MKAKLSQKQATVMDYVGQPGWVDLSKAACSYNITPVTRRVHFDEIDHTRTGRLFRAKREIHSISLRDIARSIGLSAPYISDLERGRRNWTEKLVDAYNICLNEMIRLKDPKQ